MPLIAAGGVVSAAVARRFFYDLYQRTIDRNLGIRSEPNTDELGNLLRRRDGDVEALVAAIEPAVKQAHNVVGEGAQLVNIFGGVPKIGVFDEDTKRYVRSTVTDESRQVKDVSVASFNVNSGYGGVFDEDLGRIVTIKLTKHTLHTAKSVLSWGLDQYANGTGAKVTLKYYTLRALDGTPKQYVVVDAVIPGR